MAELSDESLMAYADGELASAESARVEAMLARNPMLRARLEVFEATGRRLADCYRAPMEEAPPRELVDLVMRMPVPVPKRQAGLRRQQGQGLGERLRSAVVSIFPGWPAALAYSAVALVAAGAGWSLHGATGQDHAASGQLVVAERGRLVANGALHRALETVPSGVRTNADDSSGQPALIAPHLTYKNLNMEYCRQYDLTIPAGQSYAGVGCRGNDGRWQIQLHVPTVARQSETERVVPAAGDSVLQAFIERTSRDDALGKDEEAAALGRQWRRP